jgi:hypothetical protein
MTAALAHYAALGFVTHRYVGEDDYGVPIEPVNARVVA